jgi:hypothetical protein
VLNLITEKKRLTLVNISLKKGVGNGKVMGGSGKGLPAYRRKDS